MSASHHTLPRYDRADSSSCPLTFLAVSMFRLTSPFCYQEIEELWQLLVGDRIEEN